MRGEGVSVIYSARPQDGRKMGCDTKRLWPGRTWGGTGKIFPANCLLSFTDRFSEGSATCGNKKENLKMKSINSVSQRFSEAFPRQEPEERAAYDSIVENQRKIKKEKDYKIAQFSGNFIIHSTTSVHVELSVYHKRRECLSNLYCLKYIRERVG